jgi:predicted nucleic acid-binding protein
MMMGRPERIPAGALVAVDAAPIIYYLENHPKFAAHFAPWFEAAAQGEIHLAISTVTLAEVVTGPLQLGNELLAAQYEQVLSAACTVLPITQQIAMQAARIRATQGMRLPDAMVVATAITCGAQVLLTHDKAFGKIKEIQVVGIA